MEADEELREPRGQNRYHSVPVPAMGAELIFHGTIIHSLDVNILVIQEKTLVVVDETGKIRHIVPDVMQCDVPKQLQSLGIPKPGDVAPEVRFLDKTHEFIIPGFVDTHNHAPQFAQRGLGQSTHILDWLEQVTFPNESRFSDPAYAAKIYDACVLGFLRQGITTASYYGSMHVAATRILADTCLRRGQRALVGKCNMERNAPDFYRDENTQASLQGTRECIAHIREIDPEGRLVQHVLTPRFAITCTAELLSGLGRIAAESADSDPMPIQTHFNEAKQEITFTRSLFPQFADEVDLYGHFGLLTHRTILAHCCFMEDGEIERLKDLGCGVAHCPISNMTVGGGFMAAPIRQFLERGLDKIGLGTDSGGGYSSSILDAMRQALVASNAREVQSQGRDKGLSIVEIFYLATLGGARVCGLDAKVGNIIVGKEFDALIIDARRRGVMTMVEDSDPVKTVFEKFVMTGDDRNIVEVFVRGRSVETDH